MQQAWIGKIAPIASTRDKDVSRVAGCLIVGVVAEDRVAIVVSLRKDYHALNTRQIVNHRFLCMYRCTAEHVLCAPERCSTGETRGRPWQGKGCNGDPSSA